MSFDIMIAAIGRAKGSAHAALIEEYARRLPWPLAIREADVPKPLPPQQRKAAEGELLLKAASECEVRVALDPEGNVFSSEDFAAWLQKQQDSGVRSVAFFIGGADGLDDALLSQCRLKLSFGRMIWPHLLARVMLAEQLYRAHTILTNHPYHRG